MAEIKLTRIKSLYGDIKGLFNELSAPETYWVSAILVNDFNDTIDELSQIAETDYSRYKVPIEAMRRGSTSQFNLSVVRANVGRVLKRLEEEYGFGINSATQSPSIAIFNKNQNEISLQINYTINDLISRTDNDEEKAKLQDLNDEIEKPVKNWAKIKPILLWILNFSKDLFLQVLPIILQAKI